MSTNDASPELVRILLVDDRPENLFALEAALRADYEVVTAGSGPEALMRLLEKDFALVVLDVIMPEMDGFEVARLMKQREKSRGIPVLFLTGVALDVQLAYKGYAMGAVDYLTKPIDLDLLRAKVAVFADLYRKTQQLARQAEQLREHERRQGELALAEARVAAEARYRFLSNAVPQLIWVASPDGKTTHCNDRAIEYAGLSLEDLRARGWESLVHPEDADASAQAWSTALRTREPFGLERRLRSKDGTYRWHLTRAVPEISNGEVVSWIGSCTDVDEFRRLRLEAQRAVAMREEILAVVSHDLRNPLTAIKTGASILTRAVAGDDLGARVGHRAETILRSAERMERLINDLLDMAGLQAGNLTVERRSRAVRPLLDEAMDALRPTASERGIRVDVEVPEEPLTAVFDQDRILQVLSNLVGNAIKFTPKSGVVTIEVENAGGEVKFSVSDTGPGIAPEDLPRIFQPYWKGRELTKGTGLGLYISKGLIEVHGGRLWVESPPGQGATFRFTLPVDAPARDAATRGA